MRHNKYRPHRPAENHFVRRQRKALAMEAYAKQAMNTDAEHKAAGF
ncbi:MAG: hypothetical protein AB2799_09315 [Candidatus Thiodiazotropha sp.]